MSDGFKISDKEGSGNLKIFLGYAPGVGKTYSMLNEANRRSKRGQDIVIGYLETHDREETEKQVSSLEVIPRKKINYNGITMEEMDTDAIIVRKPDIVLVDELAHTNVPGAEYKKRYEDVQKIIDHGINVISTLNIQHLESLNDVIKQITGVTVKETIPDKIVDSATEIVVVDITPNALQSRLKRGNIYKFENIDRALKNFFRRGKNKGQGKKSDVFDFFAEKYERISSKSSHCPSSQKSRLGSWCVGSLFE